MKLRWVVILLVALAALSVAGWGKETLVVYTYDSFLSWGPATDLEKAFESKYDCDLQFVTAGGAKATLSRLLAERENGGTPADLFMGELNDVPRIASYNLFLPVNADEIPNLAVIPDKFGKVVETGLVPYEYGYITLTYDSQALAADELPQSLSDLTAARYRKKLVCEDPRTSSTGFSFLLWTIARFGEDGYLAFWQKLDPTILTITQGWSEAWTLLTHGEAPLMVSYSTDTAYAAMYEKALRFRAYAPGDEGYRTVYGIGIVRGTKHRRLAEEFIDLLLSKRMQALLPKTEIMFPVNRNAALPAAFQRYAIVPKNEVFLPISLVGEKAEKWLNDWARVMTKK